MLTSFGWSLIVHSVSVSLRTLLLDLSNVDSFWTEATDCARASDPWSEIDSLSLSLSMAFATSSRGPSRTWTKPSVCCGCRGLLILESFPHFCFFLGGLDSSNGSSCVSVTGDFCASFWLVTSSIGRRAALRAANALTASSAVRRRTIPRIKARLYLPLLFHQPGIERQARC